MTQENLRTRIDEIKKQLKPLSLPFKTVFEINLKTATKTIIHGKCVEARNGKYVLTQENTVYAPTYGDNYVENKTTDYMIFCCPELMLPNISIFVVSFTPSTSGLGEWRYIIGNNSGNYDKFIAYKAYSYSKVIHGGGLTKSKYTEVLPTRLNITHNKNLLSCHWLQTGSCMFGNGSFLAGSNFDANLKHIGYPYGSIFYNERYTVSRPQTTVNFLKGKIFGFKIVQGLLTEADIIKIHKEMIKEYDVDI